MSRFFKDSNPRASDYAGLALFAVIYLTAFGLVVAPNLFMAGAPGAIPASISAAAP